MDSPVLPVQNPSPFAMRDRALGIIATATVLALLYFARDVLVPVTLAIILSLLIAPLVRMLRRVGLGQTASVLAAVMVLALLFSAIAAVIVSQLAHMSESLPRYERTIERKLATLNDLAGRKFSTLTALTDRLANRPAESPSARGLPPPATGARRTGAMRQSEQTPAASDAGQGTAPEPASQSTVTVPTPDQEPAAASRDEPRAASRDEPRAASRDEPRAASRDVPRAVSRDVPRAVSRDAPPIPIDVIEKIVRSIWLPFETTGIVLVVLIFVLLEYEALRDRFIRIVGGSDIRRTTLAINDAGERLSRFFVSQFAVNFGVGVMVWIGLSLVTLPHPLLWAALAAVLRFVPYVGLWIAALCATSLGAAVDPGWAMAARVLGLFVIVELLAGQLVEPQLYGHTTGLSPLSVVIAAIFWGWLWGPIGLIVSTPLTLCLLVAGRHIKALSLLEVLLGDAQALTMPERFYQRALSDDSDEIISSARVFLKRNSFATYCDLVLMPALHLARMDLMAGAITADQQARVRGAMVTVIAAIGGENPKRSRRRPRVSVLDNTTAGRLLRQQRERVSGHWQGPLTVPPGSVMLCVGLGSELLVRILRDQNIDARHVALEDLADEAPPEGAAKQAVSMVYIVSAFPSEERARAESTAEEMRRRLPQACIVAVFLPGMLLQADETGPGVRAADKSATSLGSAVQICLDMHREHA
jgi:predicted PurR-regulated permease PerM